MKPKIDIIGFFEGGNRMLSGLLPVLEVLNSSMGTDADGLSVTNCFFSDLLRRMWGKHRQ